MRGTGAVRSHLSLATGHCDVDKPSGVCDSLLSSTFGGLLLLLGLDLTSTTQVSFRHQNTCRCSRMDLEMWNDV